MPATSHPIVVVGYDGSPAAKAEPTPEMVVAL